MIKTKIKNNQKKNIIIEIERVITFYFLYGQNMEWMGEKVIGE